MKRIIIFMLLIVALTFSLVACGNNHSNPGAPGVPSTPQSGSQVTKMYWSAVTEDVNGNAASPTGYTVVCRERTGTVKETDVGNTLSVPLASVIPSDGVWSCYVYATDGQRGSEMSNVITIERSGQTFTVR